MLPRWKTQFFIKFFEGGIIMQEGNRGQPKEDPFHVFVPLLPLNMAQNDISDSPIPSWNVPGPWNYPETAVSRQFLPTKSPLVKYKMCNKIFTRPLPGVESTSGNSVCPKRSWKMNSWPRPPWKWPGVAFNALNGSQSLPIRRGRRIMRAR